MNLEGPELSCYHCGTRDFIHHEAEPGQPTKLECSACRSPIHVNITSHLSRIRTWDPSTYGMMSFSHSISDAARYDLVQQGARFFHFLEFLAAIELEFVERLYFVNYGDRVFGVMAYSRRDAEAQVQEAHFQARWRPLRGWMA